MANHERPLALAPNRTVPAVSASIMAVLSVMTGLIVTASMVLIVAVMIPFAAVVAAVIPSREPLDQRRGWRPVTA